MDWLGLGVVGAMVAGGLYVHGPFGDQGIAYHRAPAEAVVALGEIGSRPLQDFIDDVPGASTAQDIMPQRSVTWRISVGGKEAASYVADVKTVNAGEIRVVTSLNLAPDAGALLKGRTMPMDKQLATIGKALMDEEVAATLQGRPVDPEVRSKAQAAYAVSNPGEVMTSASAITNKGFELQQREMVANGTLAVR